MEARSASSHSIYVQGKIQVRQVFCVRRFHFDVGALEFVSKARGIRGAGINFTAVQESMATGCRSVNAREDLLGCWYQWHMIGSYVVLKFMSPVLEAFLNRSSFGFDLDLRFRVENTHEMTATPTNDAYAPVNIRLEQRRHDFTQSTTPAHEIDTKSA